MIPHLNNEKGITLVELLAVIVVSAIIGIIGYSILFSGMLAFDQTKAETELRDEADLIMATLLNEMYTLKSSEFESIVIDDTNGEYYFPLSSGDLGFKNHQPVINGRGMIINNNIKLTDETKIDSVGNYRYEITLELKNVETERKLKTESAIKIINDNSTGGSSE